MKRELIIIFMFLMFGVVGYAQQNYYDRINIYAIPLYTDFASDDIDANYVRSHYVYKFSSKDKYYIEDICNVFMNDNRDTVPIGINAVSSNIRIVVDFVRREKIVSFVLVNSAYVFFVYEKYNDKCYYKLNRNELCYIKTVIPFFDKLIYKPLECK